MKINFYNKPGSVFVFNAILYGGVHKHPTCIYAQTEKPRPIAFNRLLLYTGSW